MKKIIISAEDVSLSAELNDSATAQGIWDALPFEGEAGTWGDEIYFGIPVDMNEEPDARADVEVGTLGYWPVGSAFCIFFGPTPSSTDDKPRAASPVNIFGRVIGDATKFRAVQQGSPVRVEADNT
ncbi:cyclophilin-like fold protein [Desulfobacterales bacterium HSG2]|nr:cyclophilin-like fold protein [Desulfobacterales bacterium HSG2]